MRGRAVIAILTVVLVACRPGLDTVVAPSPTGLTGCAALPTFAASVDASYPSDLLETQQRIIAGGVGTDRLAPTEPALEYFARIGMADRSNTRAFDARYTISAAAVTICRTDGSVIEAAMYRPFPASDRPIWAVRAYRLGR